MLAGLILALACLGSGSPPALADNHGEICSRMPPAFVGLCGRAGAGALAPAPWHSTCQSRAPLALRLPRPVPRPGRLPERTALAAEREPAVPPAGRSVGIDLGTTNSAVAAIVDGKPVIVRCEEVITSAGFV